MCAFARQNVTVALSGDGGDELFGGYNWYKRYQTYSSRLGRRNWRPARGFLPPKFVPARDHLFIGTIGDPLWLYAVIRGSLSPKKLSHWKHHLGVDQTYDELWAYRSAWRPHLTPRKAAQVLDLHTYLPDDILTKVDRVSMLHSLECRPALLSTNMVETAFLLPERFVYSNNELKGGLRKTLRDHLPSSVLAATKQGFSVPDTGWRTELIEKSGSVQEALLTPYLEGTAY